jgi:hypothetical protein
MYLGYEVLTVLNFTDYDLDTYKHFGQNSFIFCVEECLKMKGAGFFETSVYSYQTTLSHTPEDCNLVGRPVCCMEYAQNWRNGRNVTGGGREGENCKVKKNEVVGACSRERANACNILSEHVKWRDCLKELGVYRRIILKRIWCIGVWTGFVWPRISDICEYGNELCGYTEDLDLLSSCETVSFSIRTLFHGIS